MSDPAWHAPLEYRGVKINLPWASYRQHESLALHADTMRTIAYWERLLDFLAECRFNLLTLWSLHPFYYMIDVPGFPEARMYTEKELEQWQIFWRKVFLLAHQRGLKTYLFFWNIFVSPAFARHHGVCQYCEDWSYIGDGETSSLIEDYNHACVRTLIDTYADLDGIGVAMSERMGGMTPEERADWVERVIVAGLQEASRPAGLCLRIPHSSGLNNGGSTSLDSERLGRQLLEKIRITGPLWTEIKFNWSHGHSTPVLRKIHGGASTDVLWTPPSDHFGITWMVRNEDFFVLRWAGAEFIRQHIQRNHIPGVCGYLVGSECYIPAKDYITTPRPGVDWTYAFERQWLFYFLWGRLLEDPSTPDEVFIRKIDSRYGAGTGSVLWKAWGHVASIPLQMATFFNFTWDHTLYVEGFLGKDGFLSLENIIQCQPVEPDWLSVLEFVARDPSVKLSEDKVTPCQLAETISRQAHLGRLALLPLLERVGAVAYEVRDILSWCSLGEYFADKLRAAVDLAEARQRGSLSVPFTVVDHLRQATDHWRTIVQLTEPYYRPVPLQICGNHSFSWADLLEEVEAELSHYRTVAGIPSETRSPS